MDREFRLFPEAASTVAQRVDNVYFFLLSVASFFTLLIFFLIVGFCIYYRRSAKVDRAMSARLHGRFWLLEITWSLIPLGLTLVMFGWGAEVYYHITNPPDDCLVIDVVGKQWMWKVQHPGGRREINSLHVPVDTPVRLRMISEDVIHSFYVPNFRVKQDVLPNRYTTAWFEPTKTGQFHLFCAEYCGTSHAQMRGYVYVQSQADHAAWLRGGEQGAPAVVGKLLFEQFRCVVCHTGAQPRCPSLVGLVGSRVPLRDGDTAIADDQYLRESILDPTAKVVAGYQPLMPTFRGQIGEEEILALVAYIKTLRPDEAGMVPRSNPPTVPSIENNL
jgi:cytochrome c oxidase subunit 2